MTKAHLHLTIDEEVKKKVTKRYPNLSRLVEDLLRSFLSQPLLHDQRVEESATEVAKEYATSKEVRLDEVECDPDFDPYSDGPS